MSYLQTLLDQLNVLKTQIFQLKSSTCVCCDYKNNIKRGLISLDMQLSIEDINVVMTNTQIQCVKCEQLAILRPQLIALQQQVSESINTTYSVTENPFLLS